MLKKGEVYDPHSTETEAGNVFEIKSFGEIISERNADPKAVENQISKTIYLIGKRLEQGGEMKGSDKPENQKAPPLSEELRINVDIQRKKK